MDVGRCRRAVCVFILRFHFCFCTWSSSKTLHTHTEKHTRMQYQSRSLQEPAACAQASLCFSDISHTRSYLFAGLSGDNWCVTHLNVEREKVWWYGTMKKSVGKIVVILYLILATLYYLQKHFASTTHP